MNQIPRPTADHYDAVIVGAGFAGLYMLYRLRALGLTVKVYEAAPDIGGVWYWNRYPGARCDVESMQYSYSFSEELQQEWNWSERFATQPEILSYINHVATRFDLRPHIELGTRIKTTRYDGQTERWIVEKENGQLSSAKFCIMATGCLSVAKQPDIPGAGAFKGDSYLTSSWPHHPISFAGKRVGVIGTGSTAIQAVPIIAEQAAALWVFQRTPSYSVPARNAPLTEEQRQGWKQRYSDLRHEARYTHSGTLHDFGQKSAGEVSEAEREAEFEARWKVGGPGFTRAFNDIGKNKAANDSAADFIRSKIRQIVKDPAVAKSLSAMDYPLAAKRICVDTNYYQTFNKDHVTLVDLRKSPIEAITENGIRTAEGEIELDAIVFATGFDAMTGALNRINPQGKAGVPLAEKWAAGPRSYLGLMIAGFPNLFTITGPGSPSVLSNVMVSIEQHVGWISNCIEHMLERGLDTIEASQEAEDRWVEHVNEVASSTFYPAANSWYLGANVPGKPRVFMPYPGGVGNYRKLCDEVAREGYKGFELSKTREAEAAPVVAHSKIA